MSNVTLSDVSLTYESGAEDIEAVRDFSLEVQSGDFVSIIGPSGCGKSSLLRLVGGFLTPTSGEVRIGGERVTGPGPDRGVIFQNYALFPWKTVLGNVTFGLKHAGVDVDDVEAAAIEQLEGVGLAEFADAYPKELSGGMKQRVAIARALAYDPDILLMDEPFGALDAQTREVLQEELIELWRESGKTIFFVTHNIEEAVYLSNRIIVMTDRPGTNAESVSVSFDRSMPREDIFVSDEFTAAARRIRVAIGESVEQERFIV